MHHDLELFETEYRRQRAALTGPAEMPQISASARTQYQVTSLNDTRHELLRGVTSEWTPIPDTSQVLEAIDSLASASLPSATTQLSSAVLPFNKPSMVPNATHNEPNAQQYPDPQADIVPIGREVIDSAWWECQGRGFGDGQRCHVNFPTLELLGVHFRGAHSLFVELHPPFLFHCLTCGCVNEHPSNCFGCDGDGFDRFEKCYYGLTIQQKPLDQLHADLFPANGRGGHGSTLSDMQGCNSKYPNAANSTSWASGLVRRTTAHPRNSMLDLLRRSWSMLKVDANCLMQERAERKRIFRDPLSAFADQSLRANGIFHPLSAVAVPTLIVC